MMVDGLPELSRRIAEVLAIEPSARALEFKGRWHSWGDLATSCAILAAWTQPGQRVAVLLRNRPPQIGLVLGLIATGACVVTVNPERGKQRVRADLESLGISTVAGDRSDLETLAPPVRWLQSDSLGHVELTGVPRMGEDSLHAGVRVEMLTRGPQAPAAHGELGAGGPSHGPRG